MKVCVFRLEEVSVAGVMGFFVFFFFVLTGGCVGFVFFFFFFFKWPMSSS